jgi:hypothetical protein
VISTPTLRRWPWWLAEALVALLAFAAAYWPLHGRPEAWSLALTAMGTVGYAALTVEIMSLNRRQVHSLSEQVALQRDELEQQKAVLADQREQIDEAREATRREQLESQARTVAVWPDPEKRVLFVRNDSGLPIYRVKAQWLASMGGDSVANDLSIFQPEPLDVVPPHETVAVDIPEGTKVWREAKVFFIDAAGNAWRSWRGSLTIEPWDPAGYTEADLNEQCGHRLRRLCMRCAWCVDCHGRCGCAGPVAQQSSLLPPPDNTPAFEES